MDPTTLDRTRRRQHPACWVCSPDHEHGLRVDFEPDGTGGIRAGFACDARFSGYAGFVHGGVVSSLLDGAMVSVLMALGEVAVTADLRVRFREPVRVGEKATVRARLLESRHGMHRLAAELLQGDAVRATAEARFLAHPGTDAHAHPGVRLDHRERTHRRGANVPG